MTQLQHDNIFFDVQKDVCKILNDTSLLSGISFIPENSKDIENLITQALRKQGICGVVIVEDAAFQGFDSGIDTAWQIDNLIVQIVENVVVNRASNNNKFIGTAEDVGAKVSQVLGSPEYGRQSLFNLKTLEVGEENGLIVCKVTFKCLITTDISSIVPPPVTPGDKKQLVFMDYLSSNYYDKTDVDNKILSSTPSLSCYVPKNLSSDTTIETNTKDLIVRDTLNGSVTKYSGSEGYWTIDGPENGVDFKRGAYNSFQEGAGIQLFEGSYLIADPNVSITISNSKYVKVDDKSLSAYISGIPVENANNANFASGAGTANVALTAQNAMTADYALTANNANYATKAHNSEWAEDVDEATSTTLSTYAKKTYVDGLIGTLAQTISEI